VRIDYGNAINVENLNKVWVAGEEFTGIAYAGLLNVNTKTYVEEPKRSNDGSIENINDYDTFVVPRAKFNFKYFSISDYQRLCRVVNSGNQFPVTYFDKQFGTFVTHLMYCEPEQMANLYNVGTSVIGVLDYEISFIGTLNNMQLFNVSYNSNGCELRTWNTYSSETTYDLGDRVKNTSEEDITTYYEYINEESKSGTELSDIEYWKVIDSSILETIKKRWGESVEISSGEDLTNFYIPPTGKTFLGWNTLADGTGYNAFPNSNQTIFENMTLYAMWSEE